MSTSPDIDADNDDAGNDDAGADGNDCDACAVKDSGVVPDQLLPSQQNQAQLFEARSCDDVEWPDAFGCPLKLGLVSGLCFLSAVSQLS